MKNSIKNRQGGIALLEALLASLILAIGLLGTIGLQARAYSALSDAGLRAEATLAADKLLGAMANDQANLAAYGLAEGALPGQRLAAWHRATQSAIPGAKVAISVSPSEDATRTAVVVTISWQRKSGGPVNQHVLTSYLAHS